jgi:hypothetical protein
VADESVVADSPPVADGRMGTDSPPVQDELADPPALRAEPTLADSPPVPDEPTGADPFSILDDPVVADSPLVPDESAIPDPFPVPDEPAFADLPRIPDLSALGDAPLAADQRALHEQLPTPDEPVPLVRSGSFSWSSQSAPPQPPFPPQVALEPPPAPPFSSSYPDAQAPPIPPASLASSPTHPEPFATPAIWTVVVGSDRAYYDRMQLVGTRTGLAVAFPAFTRDRRFPLEGRQIRIGRRSAARGLEPEIDMSVPPADPGISRLHAVFIPGPNGSWSLLDPGSANGTLLNGREVAVGELVPLHDGDRINLGVWTVITVHHG